MDTLDMNPNPGPAGPGREHDAAAEVERLRALAEIAAWTNAQGRTFDPRVRDCLACGGYRDPFASACACGRALTPLLVRRPRPETDDERGERQVRVIKLVLAVALPIILITVRIVTSI
jgi:hypothetical protein